MRKRLMILILLPLALNASYWESSTKKEFAVSVFISQDEIPINDSLTIRIIATAPASYLLDNEKIKQQILSNLNIVSQSFTLVDEQVQPHKIIYTLKTRVVGDYFINLLTIPFTSETEGSFDFIGKLFPISVTSARVADPNILKWTQNVQVFREKGAVVISKVNRDLYHSGKGRLEEVAYQNRTLFKQSRMSMGIFVIIACVILLAIIFWRTITSNITPLFLKPRDPQVDALKAIKRLPIDTDNCYEGISHIIRTYFQEKHHLQAISKTFPEIVVELNNRNMFDENTRKKVSKLFSEVDKALYFGVEYDDEQSKKAIATAKDIIRAG